MPKKKVDILLVKACVSACDCQLNVYTFAIFVFQKSGTRNEYIVDQAIMSGNVLALTSMRSPLRHILLLHLQKPPSGVLFVQKIQVHKMTFIPFAMALTLIFIPNIL